MPVEATEIIRWSVALIKSLSTEFISRSHHSFAIRVLHDQVVVGDVLEFQEVVMIYSIVRISLISNLIWSSLEHKPTDQVGKVKAYFLGGFFLVQGI